MRLWVGTSGYAYREWLGKFYPERLPPREMLAFYADRLPAVEINSSFFGIPKRETVLAWVAQVPAGFRFAVKAPRKITHDKLLAGVSMELGHFLEVCRVLGDRLGPVLFQLPPYFPIDTSRLERFLDALPQDLAAAFEFRHPSWHTEAVYGAIGGRGHAICTADSEEKGAESIIATANWGYLRLRRTDYRGEQLEEWLQKILMQPWQDVYVFFRHEQKGLGPEYAGRLLALVDERGVD